MKKCLCVIMGLLILVLGIGVVKMPYERTYYVICGDNCKFEGMTKEQTLAAIAEATGETSGSINVDAAFISKLKETNRQGELTTWIGTEAEYNALETRSDTCLYIIIDGESTEEEIAALSAQIQGIAESTTSQIQAISESTAASIAAMQEDIENVELAVSSCVVNGDFATISGTFNFSGRTDARQQLSLSYPSGFSSGNCAVISTMIKGTGDTWSCGTAFKSTLSVSGAMPAEVILSSSGMTVNVSELYASATTNGSGSLAGANASNTFSIKIVLMKI